MFGGFPLNPAGDGTAVRYNKDAGKWEAIGIWSTKVMTHEEAERLYSPRKTQTC